MYLVGSMHKNAQYLLASIVESSQDSIVTIDLNHIVTSWNKGAEELYGYSAEEAIGKSLSMVMLPDDIKGLIGKVNSIIQDLTVPIFETVRVHKNGRSADLEILMSPVRNPAGEVVGMSTVARDITVRKMHEQQKDDFISIASHELKTPVTSIKMYTEVIQELLEHSDNEQAAVMVRKLDVQVDRLIGLVGTLLDTTKLAAGQMRLEVAPVDLGALIEEQIEIFSLLLGNHQLVFRSGTVNPVIADRRLIGQVLTNLIANAAKFSPKGGEILIASKEMGNNIEVSVQDQGIGIPPEAIDTIFDRYFRVSNPLIASASGLGLGLYITAEIVRQHEGTISVEGEEGKGATFFFTLPLTGKHTQNAE